MITIKIKMVNDEITTTENGTLAEIARRYFTNKEVVEIEILGGVIIHETEYCTTTATRIYKVPDEIVKEFQLWNNVRYDFKVEYKNDYILEYDDYTTSAGLCNVAQPKRSDLGASAVGWSPRL